MILRPLVHESEKEAAAPGGKILPAWDVVQEIQKREYESCWMITQPSHAALSGDIAEQLSGKQLGSQKVPELDPGLVRAIAMHDAGWGMADAQAVQMSRMGRAFEPRSFLHVGVLDFLEAWGQSAGIAQTVSPAGGYIVSQHFWRLAEHRLNFSQDTEADRKKLKDFLGAESARQKKLAAKQERSAEELEALTDLLQFCDLLSLYICSGAQETVEFPEYLGVKVKLMIEAGGYRLEPALISSGAEFSVAALRHPASKEVSGQEIGFKIW